VGSWKIGYQDPIAMHGISFSSRTAGFRRTLRQECHGMVESIAMRNSKATSGHLSRLSPARLIVALWIIVAILNIALSFLGRFDLRAIVPVAITSVCGLLLSLAVLTVTPRIVDEASRFALPQVVSLAVLNGSALWFLDVLVQAWITKRSATWSLLAGELLDLRLNWVYFVALFVLQAVASALLTSARNLAIRERQLVEAQLAALRFQLNPHFLFNTLNAIASLVADGRAADAEEMITRLSDFLRTSLSDETTGLTTLGSELDTVQAYLEIESVRFGERMKVHYACDPGLTQAQVPSLILQPLVENAVKYAVTPSKEQVTLSIEASATGERNLILVVEDDGRHATEQTPTPSTGVGLRNVAARLNALYGSSGHIEAIRRERGFTAVVRLPLQYTSNG
jgi:signal transduction histidine kinase